MSKTPLTLFKYVHNLTFFATNYYSSVWVEQETAPVSFIPIKYTKSAIPSSFTSQTKYYANQTELLLPIYMTVNLNYCIIVAAR